jgi:subtilase family serine protease
VRTVTWSPISAGIGEPVTITAKIENLGLTDAADIHLVLKVDGIEAGATDIAGITSGNTATADFTWTVIEGEHTIEVMCDALQTITESNETNNTKTRTLTFTKPEAPEKKTPIVTLSAAPGGGFLDEMWWVLLMAGGVLGLGILYTTIRNMRKK